MIIINIDVMLAKRKMSVTELSEKVGITMAILTPIAFPRLSTVVAARTSTPGAFGIDQGLARSKRSTSGAAIPAFTGTIKENAAWGGQSLKLI